MKFVILGAGALGSVIAAYLAREGEEVALIARGDRARHLAENGVTISGLEDFTVPWKSLPIPLHYPRRKSLPWPGRLTTRRRLLAPSVTWMWAPPSRFRMASRRTSSWRMPSARLRYWAP